SPEKTNGGHAYSGIRINFQRLKQSFPNSGVFLKSLEGVQRLNAHGGIAVQAGSSAERAANVRIAGIHAQHVERIKAYIGIEPLAILKQKGERTLHIRI